MGNRNDSTWKFIPEIRKKERNVDNASRFDTPAFPLFPDTGKRELWRRLEGGGREHFGYCSVGRSNGRSLFRRVSFPLGKELIILGNSSGVSHWSNNAPAPGNVFFRGSDRSSSGSESNRLCLSH